MNRDFNLAELREHYKMGELLEEHADANPFIQFRTWLQQALDDKLFEPNAMSLATVGADHQPSCRTVLLKDLRKEGLIFYTNYGSRKGDQLKDNDKAALLFWWREHERQVRFEGTVSKIPREDSVAYFKKRPQGSQIAASASPQGKVMKDRVELDELFSAKQKVADEGALTCPEDWGGYMLNPTMIEFWQGRPNRLHDRLEYRLTDGVWTRVRLAP